MHITQEQILGSRTRSGSEPGPFVLKRVNNGILRSVAILEVVHPSNAHLHFLTRNLGRTGGHLYLVIRPLDRKLSKDLVLIIWGINTASSNQNIAWEDISESASNALFFHSNVLAGERLSQIPSLKGLIVANTLDDNSPTVINENSNAPLAIIPSDPNFWRDHLDELSLLLDDRFERLI